MKVKTILVSQPEPKPENSPYTQIIENHNVKVDFVPFIKVEGMTAKDIRMQKIDLTKFTAIILTSRKSVDHYFRIADEMRFTRYDEVLLPVRSYSFLLAEVYYLPQTQNICG